MRTGITLVVAFLLFVSTVIEAKEPTSAVVDVSWSISLDADGHVTKLATSDKRVPKLHTRLENTIRGWHFSPGKVNGQPAATDSNLRTSLEIRLVADGFEVRVLSAATGGFYGKMTPPHYPEFLARAGKQGEVVLLAHYNGTGATTDVAPYEHGPSADVRLVQAAMTSVKKWTFAPEVVGGHPVPGSVLIPVCFSLYGLPPPACDWKNPATGESLSAGQAVALNPAAKLESDVIGQAL